MEQPSEATDRERVYGDSWASLYDQIYPDVDEVAVNFLVDLSGTPASALELAVGTGRVAIPLSLRGVEVTGIDISQAMLNQLAANPDGRLVSAILGDMVDIPVDGTFPLVFIAANSIFVISSQERQVECFRNVAAHLQSGGRFVLECFVPDMKRFDSEHRHESEVGVSSDGGVQSEISLHFPYLQKVESKHSFKYPDGSERVLPVPIRYAWPAELDLMAQLAGLVLEDRFEWYDRKPFAADSGRHVSVYVKP
jgi:ubiquinone/menaquinone biosynthesis C-methylase UbiE